MASHPVPARLTLNIEIGGKHFKAPLLEIQQPQRQNDFAIRVAEVLGDYGDKDFKMHVDGWLESVRLEVLLKHKEQVAKLHPFQDRVRALDEHLARSAVPKQARAPKSKSTGRSSRKQTSVLASLDSAVPAPRAISSHRGGIVATCARFLSRGQSQTRAPKKVAPLDPGTGQKGCERRASSNNNLCTDFSSRNQEGEEEPASLATTMSKPLRCRSPLAVHPSSSPPGQLSGLPA